MYMKVALIVGIAVKMRVNVAIYSLLNNAILIVKIVRCFYERRLKEIQEYKHFYYQKLSTADTELSKDLIEAKIEILESEEKDILKRCKI